VERSREAQRQLVLDAGHELRTPLTSIRTNLEVVRRLDELPPEDRTVLVDDLLTQMAELTALVGDLSELARGEQHQSEPAPLRLDELVEDAVTVARAHGRPRDVGFEMSTTETWVLGQRERIARAVGNLLDNALKWSPDRTSVEVACAEGVVTVRDHGPGIDPADLPHIFDRFYRSPSARSQPGSGLGLAIVAQVAAAEGGSVDAGNAEGGGAVLRLAFPPIDPPVSRPGDDGDVGNMPGTSRPPAEIGPPDRSGGGRPEAAGSSS
jgi:two-component system sensor histidine kinase MprB